MNIKHFTIYLFAALLFATLFSGEALADYTVNGVFKYEDLQQHNSQGFTGNTANRPVRYADVLVMAGSNTIAQGATDENGFFSIQVSSGSTQNISIVALTSTTNTAFLNIRAGTYNNGNNPGPTHAYPLFSANNHDPNSDIDVGEVVATYHNGGDEFNLFDVAVDGCLYLINVLGEPSPPGSPSGLRIGFTFNPNSGGFAFYSGSVNMAGIYGYDDTIMLHEIGHWVQDRFGDFSDNTGGQHFINDNQQDPRLSFGEAWPTFWGSHVRAHYLVETGDNIAYNHPTVYMNSNGSIGGGQGFSYDLETTGSGGAASEQVVQATLWDMTDNPDTPDFSPGVDDDQTAGYYMNRTVQETWDFATTHLAQPPFSGFLTYEDWYQQWIAVMPNPQVQTFNDMQRYMHGIQYFPDEYEPNNSLNEATEITPELMNTFLQNTTFPAGDEDWFKFEALEGVGYNLNTQSMLDGADTYLRLYDASSNLLASNDDVGTVGGPPNATEVLRSVLNWTAPANGTYYAMINRSPNNTDQGGGLISQYGNWDFNIAMTSVPSTYASISTSPGLLLGLQAPNTTQELAVYISNQGTEETLTYEAFEFDAQGDSIADFSWLSVSTPGGEVLAGATDTLRVILDASGISSDTSVVQRIKINSNDLLVPTKFITVVFRVDVTLGISEERLEDSQLPDRFQLAQNFPNPFNPATTIRYQLSAATDVRLEVFNTLGQRVALLSQGRKAAGTYQVTFDGENLASGLYIYKLTTGSGFTAMRKMLLVR